MNDLSPLERALLVEGRREKILVTCGDLNDPRVSAAEALRKFGLLEWLSCSGRAGKGGVEMRVRYRLTMRGHALLDEIRADEAKKSETLRGPGSLS